MTYRLKDTELQKKLDSFTDGEFSESLRGNAIVGGEHVAVVCGELVPGIRERLSPEYPDERPARRFTFMFCIGEVEEIKEYNPHVWNEWPEVTPPLCEDMRVELQTKDGLRFSKTCAHFNGTEWETWKVEHWEDYIVRFRPWVDPDEENK